jgi:hypothetical protein
MTAELVTCAGPDAHGDEAAIRATIDDYYLGWFEADAGRLAASIHPELAKRGWLGRTDGPAALDDDTFESLTRHAGAGRGLGLPLPDRTYRVRLVDVDEDIAAASVRVAGCVDFLHLVRTDDGWRIVNALWRGMADDPQWRW